MYDKVRKGIIAGVILMLILLGVLLGIKSCSSGNTDDKESGSIEVEEEFSENAEKEDVEEDADSKENVENVLDETDTKEEKAEKTDKNKKKENTPAKENQHSAVNQNHGNGANAGNNANSEKKDDAGNTGSSGNTGNEGSSGNEGGTTQEPSDSENIPDENGYYVVWDDFNFGKINNWTDTVFSSWDITLPTTTPAKGTDGAVFADGSNYAKGQARRAFNAITEDFTLELTMRADDNMDHTFLDLRSAGTTAIRLEVKGDSLYFEDTKLCQLPTEDLTALKLHISPSKGKFTISVDGATVKTGTEAKEFSLLSACTSLDELYIETGKEDVGSVVIGTVRIYTGYYINEKFLDGKNEIINDEWKTTGEVKTVFKQGTQGPDNYSAVMTSGTALERAVSYVQKGAWLEYQLLMEENAQATTMELSDDAGNTFKVAVEEGNFGYYEGNRFKKLYECKENLWYHVIPMTDVWKFICTLIWEKTMLYSI